jgi:hypothetical protein
VDHFIPDVDHFKPDGDHSKPDGDHSKPDGDHLLPFLFNIWANRACPRRVEGVKTMKAGKKDTVPEQESPPVIPPLPEHLIARLAAPCISLSYLFLCAAAFSA